MAILAKYYDALVKDEEASKLWLDFTKKHGTGNNILELAAGTGEITGLLARDGYQVHATDIDDDMLEKNRAKNMGSLVTFESLDMRSFSFEKKFDTVVCYCDSVNYLNDESELLTLFHSVYQSLVCDGVFLFDMHTEGRLEEFSEPFIEEGYIDTTAYQWVIETEGNRLYHHFYFWQGDEELQEGFFQTVFPLEKVKLLLEETGYSVEVYTDFVIENINEGERYCVIARRVKE